MEGVRFFWVVDVLDSVLARDYKSFGGWGGAII